MSRTRRAFVQFPSAQSGGLYIWIAVATLIVCALIGIAVDFGRWMTARTHTTDAIQMAKQAGGRALTLKPSDHKAAIAIASETYEKMVADRLTTQNDEIAFALAPNGEAIVAKGNVRISMPFVALFGPSSIPLLRDAARLDGPFPVLPERTGGDTSRMDLEIGVMVDISDSMAGARLQAVQNGLSDMIKRAVWPQPARFKARMALVPVAGDIRPPASVASYLEPRQDGYTLSDPTSWWSSEAFYAASDCVVSNSDDEAAQFEPPTRHRPLTRAYHPATKQEAEDATARCATPDGVGVVPLSIDQQDLLKHVATLTAAGETTIDDGILWTDHVLSPNWSKILGTKSAPGAYLKTGLRKVAVLITDGGSAQKKMRPKVIQAAESDDQIGETALQYRRAVRACAEMKRRGIEIHTIGIGLESDISGSLLVKSCASDVTKQHFVRTPADVAGALSNVTDAIARTSQLAAKQ